jgi:hypothetical protein
MKSDTRIAVNVPPLSSTSLSLSCIFFKFTAREQHQNRKNENIPPIAITSSTEVVQVCHQCGKEFQFEEIFKLPKDSDYFIEAFGAIENLPSKLKINKIFKLLKILFFRAD